MKAPPSSSVSTDCDCCERPNGAVLSAQTDTVPLRTCDLATVSHLAESTFDAHLSHLLQVVTDFEEHGIGFPSVTASILW